jgi:superoxide dismutase
MHTLPALPYGYNALEPHIDAMTVELHYSKHHSAIQRSRLLLYSKILLIKSHSLTASKTQHDQFQYRPS